MSDIEVVGDQDLVFSDNETPARQKPIGSNTDDILERAKLMDVSPYQFNADVSPSVFIDSPAAQRAKRRRNPEEAGNTKRLRIPGPAPMFLVSSETVSVDISETATTVVAPNQDDTSPNGGPDGEAGSVDRSMLPEADLEEAPEKKDSGETDDGDGSEGKSEPLTWAT